MERDNKILIFTFILMDKLLYDQLKTNDIEFFLELYFPMISLFTGITLFELLLIYIIFQAF